MFAVRIQDNFIETKKKKKSDEKADNRKRQMF